VLDTIMQLNLMLSEADADLHCIDTILSRTAARPASTSEHPEPGKCVVLFCGIDAEWLVHARHKTLGFELKKPMCHGHAHHAGGAYDILSTEPIPTNPNPNATLETERS
jgi:hypothetical protein